MLLFVFDFVFASALQVKKYDGIVFNPLSPEKFFILRSKALKILHDMVHLGWMG